MGKTNLVPLLTYFTAEEYAARKAAAHEAGVSISNFNRAAMGYAAFKAGKPKKRSVPAERAENSIGFENVADFAEESAAFENQSETAFGNHPEMIGAERSTGLSATAPADFLLTESNTEDAFANLFGRNGSELEGETKSEIYVADRRIEQSA